MTYNNSYKHWGPVPEAVRGHGDARQTSVSSEDTGKGRVNIFLKR